MRPAAILLSLGLCACATPDDPRAAWLVEQLTAENRVWWTRDPQRLAEKYARMASDPYNYMRGTAGVFLRDLERAGGDRLPTAFLTVPDAAAILLVGDPHPENLGGFVPGWPPAPQGDGFRVDFNDFDGAGHGPWVWDLRRAGLGLATLLAPIDTCPPDTCRDAAVTALADAYATAVLDPGSLPALDDRTAWGEVVDRLVDDALDDGRARDRLLKETRPAEDGGLTLIREPREADGRGMLDLTPAERAQVDRLTLAARDHFPPGFRLLDAVHRFGRGVASLPAVRYVWLWDEGDPSDADDRLVQVRETIDPPAIPGLAAPIPGLFADQADRVRAAADALWETPGSDARLGGLRDGTMTFKVTTWSGFAQGFEHVDIEEDAAEGKIGPDDLVALGRFVGARLGHAHARGTTAHGTAARDALRAELDGRTAVLVDEVVAAARFDLDRTLADHQRFLDALDRLGPWLGADALFASPEIP